MMKNTKIRGRCDICEEQRASIHRFLYDSVGKGEYVATHFCKDCLQYASYEWPQKFRKRAYGHIMNALGEGY